MFEICLILNTSVFAYDTVYRYIFNIVFMFMLIFSVTQITSIWDSIAKNNLPLLVENYSEEVNRQWIIDHYHPRGMLNIRLNDTYYDLRKYLSYWLNGYCNLMC